MWGGHSWVRLLHHVHNRWNSSHLPCWTGGTLEKLLKCPDIQWGKWMAKWCVQPFTIYILAIFCNFPCSKRQMKRENKGKKDTSHSLLWWGRIKKDQASKSIKKQWKSDLGSDSDLFYSATNKLNQIKKIRESDFQALSLQKQDLAWSLSCV